MSQSLSYDISISGHLQWPRMAPGQSGRVHAISVDKRLMMLGDDHHSLASAVLDDAKAELGLTWRLDTYSGSRCTMSRLEAVYSSWNSSRRGVPLASFAARLWQPWCLP